MSEEGRPSFEEARALVHAAAAPPRRERIALTDALGRIVAGEVVAGRDSPPCDMAAMDGFAVPIGLMNVAEQLPLGQPIFAGTTVSDGAGSARPIATGAPVPPGTGAVVPRESAHRLDGRVRVVAWGARGANIRRRGEDARAGERLMAAGDVVSAEAIGALASFGVATLPVVRLPTLAILTTGDELVPLGGGAGAHQQVDSNGPMIAAMAARAGVPVMERGHATDELRSLGDALARMVAGPADIVVTTAGVSKGTRDLVRAAVEDLGASVLVHGVRMRPGKPVLVARWPDGTLHFGLPGNPVAAAVAMRFLVFGAIRAALGLPLERGCAVEVDVEPHADSTLILKARRVSRPGDRLAVEVAADQRSHTMAPLLTADLWVELPARGRGAAMAYPMAIPFAG